MPPPQHRHPLEEKWAGPIRGAPHHALEPARHVISALLFLSVLTVGGTAGYMVLEGMPPFDALYMTVITLSTVGFHEVQALSDAGRAFTIGLIMVGLGTAFYTVGAAAEFFIEGRLRSLLERRSMVKTIAALDRHIILCGFGRLGRVVAAELQRSSMPCVVVDVDHGLEPLLNDIGIPYIIGSALEDTVLEQAGIERAAAIVISTPTDQDSVFITLSARELNPDIAIHVRAESETGARRLRLAGADQVISPYQVGGQRIANALVRPAVVDFMELAAPGAGAEIDLEQVIVSAGCPLDGVELSRLPDKGVRVVIVGIQREEEPMRLSPGANERLTGGDRIAVVGERQQLAKLSSLAGGA